MSSRFSIGIDLGTTNTALAFVDTVISPDSPDEAMVATFPVEQVVAAGAVDQRETLPSAVYVASGTEVPAGSLNLPWRAEEKVVVGHFARELGARIPTRFIHSSKSWLCHGGVDREAPILPPGSPEEDARRSPATVATLILKHLAEAWDNTMAAEDPSLALANQEITLCVPASFDAGARNLTVAAAERAGFRHLHLLEEPQAAFHSWIESAGRQWRSQVRTGDLVLVVDVGGGTSDFSLIGVTEKDGELELRRVAVGDHILLGGDNMDLALAYSVAGRLEKERDKKLDAWQMIALVQQCRTAKEALLSDPSLESAPIAILGRGTSVIGGTIRTELPRAGLDEFLLDGFFPLCAPTDQPARARRSGFRETGLPYATDPAITRHLAAFLVKNGPSVAEVFPDRTPAPGQPILPTAILFNGGVFKAQPLADRIIQTLAAWSRSVGGEAPRVLNHSDLDLAVARGAAYLGLARRGRGVRIRGGSARSYYIGIETAAPAVPGMAPPLKAMCVVPYGMEEGTAAQISGREIDLCIWTGEPAAFRFLSSTTRRHDQPGQVFDVDGEDFEEHNAIETTLPSVGGSEGEAVEVDLRSHLTEIGVLNLSCVDRQSGKEYLLEFNVRQQSAD
ncbi:Hsp70 family protein [bacterium]|nr:Hsp70 family protein [bacterium]